MNSGLCACKESCSKTYCVALPMNSQLQASGCIQHRVPAAAACTHYFGDRPVCGPENSRGACVVVNICATICINVVRRALYKYLSE